MRVGKGEHMNVLAMDQARKGAWSVYDSDEKKLLHYGAFNTKYEESPDGKKTLEYEQSIVKIEEIMVGLIREYKIKIVFLEDVPIKRGVALKQLLRLQGALIAYLTKRKIPHMLIQPRTWQAHYKYKDKDLTKTLLKYKRHLNTDKPFKTMKDTKKASLLAVKKIFNMELDNDDLADAILIGHYAVNNIDIKDEVKKRRRIYG